MKIDIDWSEAPAWAFWHGLISFQGITRVWFNDEQYAVYDRDGGPYPWGGGKGDTRHNHTRSAVEYVTNRPEPWNGEGYPPVGVTCEMSLFASNKWELCQPVHYLEQPDDHSDQVVVYQDSLGGEVCYILDPPCSGSIEFRPILTPEQIAEQKRNIAALKMFNIFCEVNNLTGAGMDGFYALYDAGFVERPAND